MTTKTTESPFSLLNWRTEKEFAVTGSVTVMYHSQLTVHRFTAFFLRDEDNWGEFVIEVGNHRLTLNGVLSDLQPLLTEPMVTLVINLHLFGLATKEDGVDGDVKEFTISISEMVLSLSSFATDHWSGRNALRTLD